MEERNCRNCHASFNVDRLEETRNGGKKRMFCGADCETAYLQKRSERGADWPDARDKVLYRDLYCCALCGSTSRLAVHHISPYKNSRSNSHDNLITLCSSCHVKEDNWVIRFGKPSLKVRDYMRRIA